jgi:exodeoxyribonuclease VII large subunit
MEGIRSVIEVTRLIKALVESDETLADLWVEGEVSNWTRAASGHCYFTLKDAESEIRCVMWRNAANRLTWLPAQGDLVEVHGAVNVYERSGQYQLYADALQRAGLGARWRDFLELKARLEAEGLFDPERKRPLPVWPQRIGVVTSPTGAALRDIVNVIEARYPLVELVISPAQVQGDAAPASLVLALQRLDALADLDVIIVARGGGSQEDLWAFNDERVARALAATRVPVVTGVGHETDLTIVDFIADLRAPTPSAAAAAVVPDQRELHEQLLAGERRLAALLQNKLTRLREQWTTQRRLLKQHGPQGRLDEQRQRIDELLARGTAAIQHRVALLRAELAGARGALAALDPRRVIGRGYAIVQDARTGAVIGSATQVVLDQAVNIHMRDGSPGAVITRLPTEPDPRGQGGIS